MIFSPCLAVSLTLTCTLISTLLSAGKLSIVNTVKLLFDVCLTFSGTSILTTDKLLGIWSVTVKLDSSAVPLFETVIV